MSFEQYFEQYFTKHAGPLKNTCKQEDVRTQTRIRKFMNIHAKTRREMFTLQGAQTRINKN